MKKLSVIAGSCMILLFAQCNEQPKQPEQTGTTQTPVKEVPLVKLIDTRYQVVAGKDSVKAKVKSYSAGQQAVLCAVNRTDMAHLMTMDSVLIPEDLSGSVEQYSVFPPEVEAIKEVRKVLYFSYPAQQFAAYEYGRLVRTGATNMGRKKDPTPTGLFFTNWKAEETRSTFNDEWELKWNFNIENKEGVGFHEYEMPGYPASHSCLRLQEADAKYLYDWADQWVLKGTDNILAKGTPVIVFGSYPFGSAKPWMQLAQNSHALDISAAQLEQETQPHLSTIVAEQQKQDNVPDRSQP